MKIVVTLALLFVFAFGKAQDTTTRVHHAGAELYELKKPAVYQLKDTDFTFRPENDVIRIKKLKNDEEMEFAQLRRTTDDGLYIMTSTLNDEVSFGRFDSLGNFRTLRYDITRDSVLEDLFVVKNSGKLQDP
ncbi:MAG: hypothetical protein R3209_02220 [Salinimicrobium sediminis]|nr:hypothetical protein [Salinimicrobium sediminis]